MEEEDIRLHTFHVPGYVSGIPRLFSGGTQAYINLDTLEILAEGPIGQPLPYPKSVQEGHGEAMTTSEVVEEGER